MAGRSRRRLRGGADRFGSSPACSPCSSASRSSSSSSGRSRRARWRHALTTQVVLDALPLSLITTSVSLVITICFGLPLAVVLARRTLPGLGPARGRRRPPDRAAARGRRPRPAPRVRPSRPARRAAGARSGSRSRSRRSRSCWPRSSSRHRSSSAPRGPGSTASHASSRMPRASTAPASSTCSGGSRCPSRRAALAAGLVMTWARSLGEFGATIMFAGNVEGKTQTLPLVVYSGVQQRPASMRRSRPPRSWCWPPSGC